MGRFQGLAEKMNNDRQKQKRKTGLPPGTLLEEGTTPALPARLTRITYTDETLREEEIPKETDFTALAGGKDITWLDIVGIEDSVLLKTIGEAFDIHPLVLEDIQNTDQRTKIEDHGTYIYIAAKMLWWEPDRGGIRTEQISLILMKNMVISFQEQEGDTFGNIRNRLREHTGRVRSAGADYLLYTLLDSIVDNYFQITEEIEELLDETEGDILLGKDETISTRLYAFSIQLTELRRCFQPLREVIFQMQKREFPFIEKKTQLFINDIGDHIYIIADTHDTLREKLANLQNMHTAHLSNKMNSVMKVLTIIATIFIPLTFIVGVYGMNFEHMPELKVPWAYPLVLGVMALTVVVMLVLFKRKKWL
jgi:magnesium transporter